VRRIALVSLFVVSALTTLATGADARDGDWSHNPGPTPSAGTENGTPVVQLVDVGDRVIATYGKRRGTGSGGPVWTCRYYPATGSAGPLPGVDRKNPLPILEAGMHAWLICDDEAGLQRYAELVFYDPQNPLAGIAAGERATDEALARLPLPAPVINTSPPRGRAQLVGVPTWLWVDDPWTPRSASATLGGVTATVTATPVRVEWRAGDGTAPFACDGPGVPFDADHPDRTPTCAHTYTDRSTTSNDAGSFDLTATVTYDIAWAATNGDVGALEPLTRTATVPLVVHEAQAVLE
jgi:hypothetical protein